MGYIEQECHIRHWNYVLYSHARERSGDTHQKLNVLGPTLDGLCE